MTGESFPAAPVALATRDAPPPEPPGTGPLMAEPAPHEPEGVMHPGPERADAGLWAPPDPGSPPRVPGPAGTDPMRAPVSPAALPAEVAEVVRRAPLGPVELALSPEELGRVRLHLLPDGDAVRVVLSAERPETMDLLRRNTDQFLSELRASGFSGAAFSFAGWGDPPPAPRQAAPAEEAATALTAPFAKPARPAITPPSAGLDLRL